MKEYFMKSIFNTKYIFIFIAVLTFGLAISGCDKQNEDESLPPTKIGGNSSTEDNSDILSEESFSVPLELGEEKFSSAYGWVDDYTIVYTTEISNKTRVYSHDLRNGVQKLLYESEAPIVSLTVSPSRNYMLIHSSPSTYEALVTIIEPDGNEVFSKKIASTDLVFEWNPFDEDLILLSAFTEDWEFSAYQISIHEQSLGEISVPEPFAYWIDKNKLLYLDWDDSSQQFFAELKKYDLDHKESEEVFPSIFQVDSFGDTFMTISVEDGDQTNAIYTFYSSSLEKIRSLTVPHLSRFSDWLVPYNDFLFSKATFLTFQPVSSGEIDTYKDGFQLVSYDVKSDKQKVLFENMNNEPLSCSPNGELCLYGYYFEMLINLKKKEIMPLLGE